MREFNIYPCSLLSPHPHSHFSSLLTSSSTYQGAQVLKGRGSEVALLLLPIGGIILKYQNKLKMHGWSGKSKSY